MEYGGEGIFPDRISRVPLDGSSKARAVFTLPRDCSFSAQDLDVSHNGQNVVVTIANGGSGKPKIALFEMLMSMPEFVLPVLAQICVLRTGRHSVLDPVREEPLQTHAPR
jgi:virulence-associated protein VagC